MNFNQLNYGRDVVYSINASKVYNFKSFPINVTSLCFSTPFYRPVPI